MSFMMTLERAHQWIPGSRVVGDGLTKVVRVHTDTRTIEPGDMFVALTGDRYDASEFLAQAKDKGAVAVICQSQERLEKVDLPGLVVDDARIALCALASGWRAQFKLPLIAVTGSNGKTTVTQMIASVLRAYAPQAMLATEGNFNNDIGVPLTLLRLNASHQIAVIEMGMNHPGEIARLAAMAQPTVALVNNAQREHLEFMATVEAVARENGSVLASLAANGIAVYPHADEFSPLWHAITDSRPFMTFEICAHSETLGADEIRHDADVSCPLPKWVAGAWHVRAHTPVGAFDFALHVAGAHNVKNSLAAAACTLAAGVSLSAITEGLTQFEPVKGRSRALSGVIEGCEFDLVDDTYNANPDSVHAAIEVLAAMPGPRLLVLGDMGEVGASGPHYHAQAGAFAKEVGIDALFTVGELAEIASQQFGGGVHHRDFDVLKSAVLQVLPNYRSVLVKGSRFMKMERVVEAVLDASQKARVTETDYGRLNSRVSVEAQCS
jgi:UDP-N-acetylmuramoyl-tripeptide--D-alanyl-D-alanine ligase